MKQLVISSIFKSMQEIFTQNGEDGVIEQLLSELEITIFITINIYNLGVHLKQSY